jgi:hypothetical protein
MGFIMSKGRGTDEILKKLHKVFVVDIAATAKKIADFAPTGKNLDALALDLGISPSDAGDQVKWGKWLIDISASAAHKQIKAHLFKCLSATPPVPIYCNWIEDNAVKAPTVDLTEIGEAIGPAKLAILTVITPNYRKLPFGKKVAALRKLAGKKAAKKTGKKKAAKKKKR